MAESAPSAEQLLEALLAELSATDAVAQVTTQLFGWWPTAVIFFYDLNCIKPSESLLPGAC